MPREGWTGQYFAFGVRELKCNILRRNNEFNVRHHAQQLKNVISIAWHRICFSKHKIQVNGCTTALVRAHQKKHYSRPTSRLNQLFGKPLGLADEWAVACGAALNHIE